MAQTKVKKAKTAYFRNMDMPLFFAMSTLVVIGIIMVYSASMYMALSYYTVADGNASYFFQRQLLFAVVGFIGFFVVLRINYKLYKKFYLWIAVAVVFLLLATFLFPPDNGSYRWIPLPFFGLQPSELAKIAIIFVWASIYATKEKYLNKLAKRKLSIQDRSRDLFPKVFMIPIVFTLLYMAIMYAQSDNGSMIITLFLSGLITLAAGFDRKISLSISTVGVILVVLTVVLIFVFLGHNDVDNSNYVVGRFTAWVNPFEDYGNSGFQLANSYISLAFGGLFGDGLGGGLQKQGYLPDIHTDFILANIGEEMGYIGLLVIFVLYGIIIWRGIRIATECKDKFGKLTAFGLTALFFIQAFWNAAGITGVLPLKGLTAPLLSYGGTSLIIMMVALAILQNIAVKTKLDKQKEIAARARREKEMEVRATELIEST